MLYPLKFTPIYKQIVWGGKNIARHFLRAITADKVAESWELCCRDEGTSIVSNGVLEGKNLSDLILKYKDKLVGTKTFQKFGSCFPLLIKIIDANENLSVQVHPDDSYAADNGEESGKNELWYILDAKADSKIVFGIRNDKTKEDFIKAISENEIVRTLNIIDAGSGDSFYVPAGKVHAILGGVLIAEIQQNCNTTYRIYDWGRVDKAGKGRPLHIKQALDVIDFNSENQRGLCPQIADNKDYAACSVLRSEFFNVDRISILSNYTGVTADSFIVLMCTQGSGAITYDEGICSIILGETIMLPACIGQFSICGALTLLSIYMS